MHVQHIFCACVAICHKCNPNNVDLVCRAGWLVSKNNKPRISRAARRRDQCEDNAKQWRQHRHRSHSVCMCVFVSVFVCACVCGIRYGPKCVRCVSACPACLRSDPTATWRQSDDVECALFENAHYIDCTAHTEPRPCHIKRIQMRQFILHQLPPNQQTPSSVQLATQNRSARRQSCSTPLCGACELPGRQVASVALAPALFSHKYAHAEHTHTHTKRYCLLCQFNGNAAQMSA